jgi:hypothetical protein
MNQLAKPKILLVENEVDLSEIIAEELAGYAQKRARAQQLGAASYLDKPIAFESLLKAVEAALKGAR